MIIWGYLLLRSKIIERIFGFSFLFPLRRDEDEFAAIIEYEFSVIRPLERKRKSSKSRGNSFGVDSKRWWWFPGFFIYLRNRKVSWKRSAPGSGSQRWRRDNCSLTLFKRRINRTLSRPRYFTNETREEWLIQKEEPSKENSPRSRYHFPLIIPS